MPEYVNHNSYTVHLVGPDGNIVRIKSRQKVVLSDFFDRYRVRGFIKLVSEAPAQVNTTIRRTQATLSLNKSAPIKQPSDNKPLPIDNSPKDNQHVILEERKRRRLDAYAARQALKNARQAANANKKPAPKNVSISSNPTKRLVGRELRGDPKEMLRKNLENNNFPISNNIGVGILSYNRRASLERCINSIMRYTDLRRTTVFISDDASTDSDLVSYLKSITTNSNIVVIKNEERLGIAGNSNRLLKCLSRFRYGILLNDDVEVLRDGWETFYPRHMFMTNMVHFIYRQEGIYGAKAGEKVIVNNVALNKVTERPQGAVLAFHNLMLEKCGYFDESYGLYGMEHVDWSSKAFDFDLQNPGYFDVGGSNDYFRLHNDASAVEDRSALLKTAKERFEKRNKTKCEASDKVVLPSVSYIVPVRNVAGRDDAIKTVVNNIRAQKFPIIDIHLVEQDQSSRIIPSEYDPVIYKHVVTSQPLFNKSLAFNQAALDVKTDKIIMHDADLLAPQFYTQKIYDILCSHEACHIGSTVIYADEQSSHLINETGVVDINTNCERMVGYYEGGSLACRTDAYWRCGAFNEDYVGYGCEDCDFYARLSGSTEWYEHREIDFLHLYHGRVKGWESHHTENKTLEAELKRKTIGDRIILQYNQLIRNGYRERVDAHS